MSDPTPTQVNLTDVRVYCTGSGEAVVFDNDSDLILLSAGGDYHQVARSYSSTDVMHVHVPGLGILVGGLVKVADSDAWSLTGLDDPFPCISERPFERTDETTFDGKYTPLPELVPTMAFLARESTSPNRHIMAIQLLNLPDWLVFCFYGDLYTPSDDSRVLIGKTGFDKAKGVIGFLTHITNVGTARDNGLIFTVDSDHYVLTNGYTPGAYEYLRNGHPVSYVDPEQFGIMVIGDVVDGVVVMAHAQLRPLAHARRP